MQGLYIYIKSAEVQSIATIELAARTKMLCGDVFQPCGSHRTSA
jgi:hypothetical protein